MNQSIVSNLELDKYDKIELQRFWNSLRIKTHFVHFIELILIDFKSFIQHYLHFIEQNLNNICLSFICWIFNPIWTHVTEKKSNHWEKFHHIKLIALKTERKRERKCYKIRWSVRSSEFNWREETRILKIEKKLKKKWNIK